MVFQNILDMFIFPDSVMEMEIDYYMEQLHPYGIPLDVRRYEGGGRGMQRGRGEE
jgi:hypothetical protein